MTELTTLNDVQGTLNASITSGDTSFVLSAGQGAKFPTANFPVRIDDEIIWVGSRTSDTCSSLTRAAETVNGAATAASHSAGAAVYLVISASLLNNRYSIARGGGSAVFNSSGKLTITPASGQGVEFASGTVGIGTVPVAQTKLLVNGALSIPSGVGKGLANEVDFTVSGASSAIYGLYSDVTLVGTEGVTTNTVTNLRGAYIVVDTATSYDAAITDFKALYVDQLYHAGSGAVTTTYGVYIQGSTVGATNWALYVASNTPSFFGGTVRVDGTISIGTAPDPNSLLRAIKTITPNSGDPQAFLLQLTVNPSAAINGAAVISGTVTLDGTNGVTTNDLGYLTELYLGASTTANFDSDITNLYGIYLAAPVHAGAGVITTTYGLYIEPFTAGVTDWGVYVVSNNSFFGGNVRIDGTVGIGRVPTASQVFKIEGTYTVASGGTGEGMNAQPTFHVNAPVVAIQGMAGYPIITGVEGVTTNTIDIMYGIYFGAETLASFDSNITVYYGIYADTVYHGGGGTIGTAFGLYVEAPPTATTRWSMYLNGTANSYIGGAVGIGVNPATTAKLYVDQGTVTDDRNIIRGDGIWNAGGVTFTALEVNVSDSASAAASLLADLRVGGASKFSVRKDGAPVLPLSAAAGKLLESDANGVGAWVARPFTVGGTLLSPATGTTVMAWRAPFACTVTNVRCHFKGGTSIVYNARRNQASNHLSSNATNSTADAWHDGGAVQNTAYAAGDDLEIMFVTVTGVVTEASIQVDYTRP